MITLNHRRLFIIEELLRQTLPVTVKKLARQLGCSERTINEDVKVVDEWMQHQGFTCPIKKPGFGIALEASQATKTNIRRALQSIPISSYEFNRSERVTLMILHLLTASHPLTIQYFEHLFYLSRGTVLEDLKCVDDRLQTYGITLERKTKIGIWVTANELQIRRGLSFICKEINPLLTQIIAGEHMNRKTSSKQMDITYPMHYVVDSSQIEEIKRIVYPILRWLEVPLSDDALMTLYIHIWMVVKRLESKKSFELIEKEMQYIYEHREFKVAQLISHQIEQYFNIQIPIQEVAYITLHMIGYQKAPILPLLNEETKEHPLYQLIMKLTLVIERKLFTHFKNKDKLMQGLLLHIRPAIYRARYGLHIDNPFVNEMKQEFSELFKAIRQGVRIIEDAYNVVFPDEEIAYLTMHYGCKLESKIERQEDVLKILVVCSSGIGTANLLKTRVRALFSNIEIVNTVSYQMFLEKSDWDIHLVLSTIPIYNNTAYPILTVSPLLSDKDFKELSLYARPREKDPFTSQQLYEAIWPIIESCCDINNPKLLTEQLINQFKIILEEHAVLPSLSLGSLEGVIAPEYIALDQSASDWQDAIRMGTSLLESQGAVPSFYKDEIISILKERGPYMAVAPGIMLAHGSATDHVTKVSLSFTRLNPPVRFGHDSNDPIEYLFVFASPNRTSHVPALQQLLEKLLDETCLQHLKTAQTPWDVLHLFMKQDSEEINDE